MVQKMLIFNEPWLIKYFKTKTQKKLYVSFPYHIVIMYTYVFIKETFWNSWILLSWNLRKDAWKTEADCGEEGHRDSKIIDILGLGKVNISDGCVNADNVTSIMAAGCAQSAGVILTQNNWCLENSFRIHFLDAYGAPGVSKKFDLP